MSILSPPKYSTAASSVQYQRIIAITCALLFAIPNDDKMNGNNHYHPPGRRPSDGYGDDPPQNGYAASYDHQGHSAQNGRRASHGQQDELPNMNGPNEIDITRGFRVTLDNYNRMHTSMNNGLNLFMDVYSEQNDRLRQLEYENQTLAMAKDFSNECVEELRQRIRELETKNRILNDTSLAFACLIIDGDGALFKDEYLSQGEEGGREAAHRLYYELKKFLESANTSRSVEDHVPMIVVKIYLNVEGLTKALLEAGIIQEENKLIKFGRGFSGAQPYFDFVDVGPGKEKADLKTTKHFQLMLHMKSCKRLMLAGCHDNGYATSLEEYRWANEKITLVETTPAANGVAELKKHFKFIKFPDVFRSEPLLNRKRSQQHQHPIVTPFGSIEAPTGASQPYIPTMQETGNATKSCPLTPTGPRGSRRPSASAGHMKAANQAQAAPPIQAPNPANSQDKSHQPQPANSWATVAGNNKYTKVGRQASSSDPPALISNPRNPQPHVQLQPQTTTGKLFFYLNVAQQRLDIPLARAPDTKAREEVHKLIMKNAANFCNGYHLINRCKHEAESNNSSDCEYIHGERLGEEERKYLWYKARSTVCKNRAECRDDYCIAGHHCAWGEDCRYVQNCRFAKTHGMDLKPFYIVHEGDPCPKRLLTTSRR